MSEEKKDLQLERNLLSCGFTEKDIMMIYERAGGTSIDKVKKIIKAISYTSLYLSLLIVIATVWMLISSINNNEDLSIGVTSTLITFAIAIFVINLVVPFRIGIKSSNFLLKNR
ncbi:TPA: hypothetical protein PC598_001815 [Morganella morganii]|nr:hypothetical protein [Morganella morganii]